MTCIADTDIFQSAVLFLSSAVSSASCVSYCFIDPAAYLCLRMQIAQATGFQMGKVREDNSSFSACPFPSYNPQVYLKMGMEANFQRASKKWLQLIMPSWMQRVLWPGFSEGLLWCSFFPTWHLQSPKRCHFLGNYFERNCNFFFFLFCSQDVLYLRTSCTTPDVGCRGNFFCNVILFLPFHKNAAHQLV